MDPFLRDSVESTIKAMVMPEIEHAEKLHGSLTHDACRIITILTEEVGEAAQEVLEMTRERNSEAFRNLSKERYIHEMSQVAAVAIRAIAMEMAK